MSKHPLTMGPRPASKPTFRSGLTFVALAALCVPAIAIGACSSKGSAGSGFSGSGGNAPSGATGSGNGVGGGTIFLDSGVSSDAPICIPQCSLDHHSVLDCDGKLIQKCDAGEACDLTSSSCSDACRAAANNKQSVGCEYYATNMDMDYANQCFAVFVANTWDSPAHLQVEFYPGVSLDPSVFARIPSGSGASIQYGLYDPVAGLAPGQVAILFLAGTSSNNPVPCPTGITTAAPMGSQVQGTGMSHSFHITTDVPVVAYEINPYGGGSAQVTGASLLLPTSAWDTNYIAVTAAAYDPMNVNMTNDVPSIDIVAANDDTQVTILPTKAIAAGKNGLAAGPANMPYTFKLTKGQFAQFSQMDDLAGSVIQANKPIGVMAGQPCMDAPLGFFQCDHAEQMLPPVKALGSEYVGVMFRPRVTGDKAIWHVVGAIDGTKLTYSSDVGGPATIDAGKSVDFITDQPFVVKSQDDDHPFMLFTYMSGSRWTQLSDTSGYGDPDFVLSVPPRQYLNDYIFFTDPTYPETNLVVVRARNRQGNFDDVTLDCAGKLTGWQPVGNYEWTRVDLSRHDFQPVGNCSNGRHEMNSASAFGLWVWGWGTPETTVNTKFVSYGYPGGMNVEPLTGIVIVPTPH